MASVSITVAFAVSTVIVRERPGVKIKTIRFPAAAGVYEKEGFVVDAPSKVATFTILSAMF
jgi:hypothetical protein